MQEQQIDHAPLLASFRYRYGGDDRPNWSVNDFMHERGSVPDALLYAELFAPTFEEIEGEVFFKYLGVVAASDLASEVRRRRLVSNAALAEYVNSCNWVEVPYLFARSSGTDQEDRLLAQILPVRWRERLGILYPDRAFTTRLIEPDKTGGVVGLAFEKLSD